MKYIDENLEVKYKGISKCFNSDVKKNKNSDLLNVIFNLNELKAADNVNKGFLNGLPLKGNAEQLSISLLKIPEVEKSLDEFIINIKSFIENFSTEIVNNIDADVLPLISNNKKHDNCL